MAINVNYVWAGFYFEHPTLFYIIDQCLSNTHNCDPRLRILRSSSTIRPGLDRSGLVELSDLHKLSPLGGIRNEPLRTGAIGATAGSVALFIAPGANTSYAEALCSKERRLSNL